MKLQHLRTTVSFIIACLALPQNSDAQILPCQWLKSSGSLLFGGVVSSLITDPAGNVIEGGYYNAPGISFGPYEIFNSLNVGTNYNQFFVVKYNAQGTPLWLRGIDGSTGELVTGETNALASDAEGNIYAIINSGSYYWDAVLVKYNPAGDVLWAEVLDTSNGTPLPYYGLAADPNGNIIVSSRSALSKYSPAGLLIWTKAKGPDIGLACGQSGNIYSAGLISDSLI